MKKLLIIILATLALLIGLFAAEDTKHLRLPAINKDLIVFVYAGDIWSVLSADGDAKRLTSRMGLEACPKIHPDNRWVAF